MSWITSWINILLSYLPSITVSILTSIIASLIFWFFSFKISRTKVIFSDKLIKSDAIKPGGYRIKIANVGKRDLIEITMVAKLKIKVNNSTQVFFLTLLNLDRTVL